MEPEKVETATLSHVKINIIRFGLEFTDTIIQGVFNFEGMVDHINVA